MAAQTDIASQREIDTQTLTKEFLDAENGSVKTKEELGV